MHDLVTKFVGRLGARGKDATHFTEALAEATHKRHERYGDSVYWLEPEVKLGAGGLRDLEVARWMLAPFHDSGDLRILVDRGALDRRDLDAALAAEAFVWRVRNRLHALAGRRSDRLTFDAQETLARALGYVEGVGQVAEEEGTERFMQDHYVHARAISRVMDRATSLATRKPRGKGLPRQIGSGLVVVSGCVALADLESVKGDPTVALRAYEACVHLDAPIDEPSRDAIARAMADDASRAALSEP